MSGTVEPRPGDEAWPFACCEHCGCGPGGYWPEREGHDDTCSHGCNDAALSLSVPVPTNEESGDE